MDQMLCSTHHCWLVNIDLLLLLLDNSLEPERIVLRTLDWTEQLLLEVHHRGVVVVVVSGVVDLEGENEV